MSDPIISIEMIQRKARAAFARGAGRDDHGFNWHATAAIQPWQEEWDRCMLGWYAEQQGQDHSSDATGMVGKQLEVSPP